MAKLKPIVLKVTIRWWFYFTYLPYVAFCLLLNIKAVTLNNKLFRHTVKLTRIFS